MARREGMMRARILRNFFGFHFFLFEILHPLHNLPLSIDDFNFGLFQVEIFCIELIKYFLLTLHIYLLR